MKLYLHIGTEKTGSSYLQSIAAINREKLVRDGIWFPTAGKREKHLQSGQISAGNAQPLTDALEAGDINEIKVILKDHYKEAKRHQCSSVLLSNELLMLALSKDDNLSNLQSIALELNYSSIVCLLILRDPVDQALSLYKHRAKSGTVPEIEEWPKQFYYYGESIYGFLTTVKGSNLNLTCRKYNQQNLDEIFFKDWLGVKYELEKPTKTVNPSLGISELLLIKNLHQQNPWLPQFLYKRLLDIPKNEKDKEPRITAYYQATLAKHLKKYEETWGLCNKYLPNSEALDFPIYREEDINLEKKVLTFSDKQAEVIAAFIQERGTSHFYWHLQKTKWRRRLGLIRAGLLRNK